MGCCPPFQNEVLEASCIECYWFLLLLFLHPLLPITACKEQWLLSSLTFDEVDGYSIFSETETADSWTVTDQGTVNVAVMHTTCGSHPSWDGWSSCLFNDLQVFSQKKNFFCTPFAINLDDIVEVLTTGLKYKWWPVHSATVVGQNILIERS